jgi:hypothetical protein
MRWLYESNTPEALIGVLAEDCVWISDPSMPGGGTYRGKSDVGAYIEELFIFEAATIEVHESADLGERILGVTTFRSGPEEGPAVEWIWCQLVTFRAD